MDTTTPATTREANAAIMSDWRASPRTGMGAFSQPAHRRRGTPHGGHTVESIMKAVAAVVCLGILAASCGGVGTQAQPETVRVGPEDSGETFVLQTGDHLMVDLAGADADAGVTYTWTVAGYPEGALTLTSSDEEIGRFDFVAASEGEGSIELAGRPSCQSQLGTPDEDIECPVLGAGPGGAPVRLFAVTVTVRGG